MGIFIMTIKKYIYIPSTSEGIEIQMFISFFIKYILNFFLVSFFNNETNT